MLLKSLPLVTSMYSVLTAMVQIHESGKIMNTSSPLEGNLFRNILQKRGPSPGVLLLYLIQMIKTLF